MHNQGRRIALRESDKKENYREFYESLVGEVAEEYEARRRFIDSCEGWKAATSKAR